MSWAVLRAHRTAVRTLSAMPDGSELLSGDEEGFVVLWSLDSRRPLAIWRAHTNALLTTEFWPDGTDAGPNLVVTHGRDNKMRIWRHPRSAGTVHSVFCTTPLPTGSNEQAADVGARYPKPWLVYTQDINALNFCAVALAPFKSDADTVERTFAAPATTASERIDVYTLDRSFSVARPFRALDAADALPLDTQLLNESNRGLGAVMALGLVPDLLVAGYESGHVAAFDRRDGRVRHVVQPHTSPILSLAISEPFVLVSAADRKISVVDLDSGTVTTAAQLTHRGAASVDVLQTSSGVLAVTAGWDGKVRLFQGVDATSLAEVDSFDGGRQAGITAARIGRVTKRRQRQLRPPPAAWIAVAGKDGRVALYPHDPAAGELTN